MNGLSSIFNQREQENRPGSKSVAAAPKSAPANGRHAVPIQWRTAHSRCRIPIQMQDNRRAFSLIELLVVMAIIGMIAAIGLPAIKGLGQSNAIAAASRQLLDDLSYARMRAINNHTTVYVVFVPPDFFTPLNTFYTQLAQLTPAQRALATNLVNGQYTAYAVISKRSVGDQPGRPIQRYLSDWKYLPDGVFIDTNKFVSLAPKTWSTIPKAETRPFLYSTNLFHFPTAKSSLLRSLPYVAFTPQGQIYREGVVPLILGTADEFIPLARGSIFYPKDALGQPTFAAADVREVPPGSSTNTYRRIDINWMTGRTHLDKKEIQ